MSHPTDGAADGGGGGSGARCCSEKKSRGQEDEERGACVTGGKRGLTSILCRSGPNARCRSGYSTALYDTRLAEGELANAATKGIAVKLLAMCLSCPPLSPGHNAQQQPLPCNSPASITAVRPSIDFFAGTFPFSHSPVAPPPPSLPKRDGEVTSPLKGLGESEGSTSATTTTTKGKGAREGRKDGGERTDKKTRDNTDTRKALRRQSPPHRGRPPQHIECATQTHADKAIESDGPEQAHVYGEGVASAETHKITKRKRQRHH